MSGETVLLEGWIFHATAASAEFAASSPGTGCGPKNGNVLDRVPAQRGHRVPTHIGDT
jgi:hypothetical protein